MITYPVKWFTSEMPGAPEVSGIGVGSLVALLDACLITGFGSVSVSDIVVTSGIAKATVAPADVPPKYAVVQIDGATPSGLNGEHRVLDVGATWFIFATDESDGTATGTITSKFAPASDWSIAYTDTNKRVYRSDDPLGSRFFYRVDDTSESGNERRWARLTGYKTMTDVDTGEYPLDDENRGIWKSVSSNDTAVSWALIADSRVVYLMLRNAAPHTSSYTYFAPFAFGDMNRFSESDTTFSAVVNDTYSTSTSSGAQSGGNQTLAYGGKTYRMLNLDGESYTSIDAVPLSGSGRSGEDSTFGPIGRMLNGKNIISPVLLPPRGVVPGVYHVAHTGLFSGRNAMDLIVGSGSLEGRVLMLVPGARLSNESAAGGALIDVIGPWR